MLAAFLFLVACGSAPAADNPDAVNLAEPVTRTPAPTAVPTATTPAISAQGIEAGRTADGRLFTLGSPDAPVTLVDYSDFL
mgnify:CR=1 FL=1